MTRELARYTAASGGEIVLTDSAVRNVISNNPQVTDKEVLLFAALCKSQGLNPFTREAYLVKYGNQPASMLVGKDVHVKRAMRNPRFRGMQAGLSLLTQDGRMVRREGSMCLPGERIVGGWGRVFVDGYQEPVFDEVGFDEYAGRKKDGTLNQQWATKPGTMIRKVGLVHALREAFPEDLQGLYDASEMAQATGGAELPEAPIEYEPPAPQVDVLEAEAQAYEAEQAAGDGAGPNDLPPVVGDGYYETDVEF